MGLVLAEDPALQGKDQRWDDERGTGRDRREHHQCLVLSEQTCPPSPEMLLKMKKLKPLRVYGEAIETMEFPYPGSNRNISRKSLRDAKPKRELR